MPLDLPRSPYVPLDFPTGELQEEKRFIIRGQLWPLATPDLTCRLEG